MFFTTGNMFASINNKLVKRFDPFNPLDLPPNTVRVRTDDWKAPRTGSYTSYETATRVPGSIGGVFDVYKSGTDFTNLLYSSNNVVEVLGANTTGITNMNSMFGMCTKLTTVTLFNTSNVTNMDSMFYGCYKLASVPLFDTSSVTTMQHMFDGCNVLTIVPLFDTSNVTNMKQMFDDCYALTSVPLFDTNKVTNMSWMFSTCKSLTTVPLFDTSNVTTMNSMFVNCYKLTTVPLFDTSSVTNMTDMFMYCYKVESGALALYQQASTQANPPANHDSTFQQCGSNTQTGAAELAQIPDDWK